MIFPRNLPGVQTSLLCFPIATKEIGNVCTQAIGVGVGREDRNVVVVVVDVNNCTSVVVLL